LTSRITIWAYYAAAIVGALALMAASMLWLGHGVADPGRRVVGMTAVSGLAVVWSLVFIARIWRRQDEFARAGSHFSWYWGGALGLLATLPVYVFIAEGGLHWLNPQVPIGPHLFRAFVLGYGLAVGGLSIGMTIAWVVWWLRHR
jgi:hypothetical protein